MNSGGLGFPSEFSETELLLSQMRFPVVHFNFKLERTSHSELTASSGKVLQILKCDKS